MRMLLRASVLLLAFASISAQPALAQPPTLTTAAPVVYDFAGYTGTGLANPAAAGQLDTRSAQVVLMGTTSCAFGTAACTTGAFALGTSAGGVTTGGLYNFSSVPSAPDFGFQPSGSAFTGSTGGSLWLALVNGTGASLTRLTVTANVWVFNDQGRDTVVRAFVRNATTGTGSTSVGMVSSPAAASAPVAWVSTPLGGPVDVTSLAIANGATFYVQFTMADGPATTGARDELAIDDISVSAVPTNCGNGTLDTGEACDTGASNGTTTCGCSSGCVYPPTTTTCAPAGGMPCDAADTCDGAGACVARVAPSTTACHPSTGPCDPAEMCDGTTLTCPTDVRSAAGTTCRPMAGACDIADSCDGTSAACPDASAPNGTACDDGLVCNGADMCMAGTCMHAGAPNCMDTNACTVDACVEATPMCTHTLTAAPACCNDATDCTDGNVCTTDACTHAGGVCTFDPIADCCTTNAECNDGNPCTGDTCDTTTNHCAYTNTCIDSGGQDAGTTTPDTGARDASTSDARVTADAGHTMTPRSSGCACTVAGTRSNVDLGVLALIALALVRRARRL